MNKFGSHFENTKLIGILLLLFISVVFIIAEDFTFTGFVIFILIYIIFAIYELYYSYNGLMIKNERLVVFNVFTEQRFSILLNDIVKVDIVTVFRNSYIKILTKDYDTRKFSLKGFSLDDLKSWTSKFQKLEIEAEFIDRA